MNELESLDSAAQANLSPIDLAEYYLYKLTLTTEGHSTEEMREILTGFIWDASEERSTDESEEAS